jgi:hypothetical protein
VPIVTFRVSSEGMVGVTLCAMSLYRLSTEAYIPPDIEKNNTINAVLCDSGNFPRKFPLFPSRSRNNILNHILSGQLHINSTLQKENALLPIVRFHVDVFIWYEETDNCSPIPLVTSRFGIEAQEYDTVNGRVIAHTAR